MHVLTSDLSILTTIPVGSLKELVNKSNYLICDCVEEAKLKEEPITEIDIGIGTLQIMVENDNVLYKFIPSNYLNSAVKSTILEGKNPLVDKAESTLVDRILNTYKDFI